MFFSAVVDWPYFANLPKKNTNKFNKEAIFGIFLICKQEEVGKQARLVQCASNLRVNLLMDAIKVVDLDATNVSEIIIYK